MIFLTLGTQLPFDRLVKAVNTVATKIDETIIGQTGGSTPLATEFQASELLTPQEFSQRVDEARIIIGHAGIGTILAGLRAEKTLILMPRKAQLEEHRNDHQLATASQMKEIPGVYIVETAQDILDLLEQDSLEHMSREVSPMQEALISFIQNEIASL